MNCMALQTSEGIVVVDCGVTFPHDAYGIELIHPDFTWLWEHRDEVLGVVLTHGHEDHIGGMPYLLRKIPVPVWGPPYALTLLKSRLTEHPEVPLTELHPMRPRERFSLGGIKVEPLRVNHSIPDSLALCFDTPAGRLFHTGDFKFEPHPFEGAADIDRFDELGREGVDLLLSDSTNSDVPSRATTEESVAENLARIIEKQEGRVVVGLFASNVLRLRSIVDAAMRAGRRVCYLGRSVQTHVRAATELGLFRVPEHLVVQPEHAQNVPPRELLAIATGTQAEPASALARLARDEHPNLRLEKGDTVLFSSRTIPGNERNVFDLVCDLERRDLVVHYRTGEGEVHVSGHAAQDEQARMMRLLRPRSFVPVHGTIHHLKRHARLAEDLGVKSVAVVENGTAVRLDARGVHLDGVLPTGRVYVDHNLELDRKTIQERETMASSGAVLATLRVDATGTPVEPLRIESRGVLTSADADQMVENARAAVEEALRLARGPRDGLELEEVREIATRTLRRVYRLGLRRPLVAVDVVRVIRAKPAPAR